MIKLLLSRRALALLALAAALLAVSAVSAFASSTDHARVGDNYFKPGKITVSRGSTVSWSWGTDYLKHNVTVQSGPSKFHSKTQISGTFSHVFTKRGTYHLYCTIHPGMKETIIVR